MKGLTCQYASRIKDEWVKGGEQGRQVLYRGGPKIGQIQASVYEGELSYDSGLSHPSTANQGVNEQKHLREIRFGKSELPRVERHSMRHRSGEYDIDRDGRASREKETKATRGEVGVFYT